VREDREVGVALLHRAAAGLDFREVQNIVDDRQEMASGLVNVRGIA